MHACKCAECLLIIGTGCRVQVFFLILDSSVSLSAGIQSAGDWVSETLWVGILHSAEEDNLSPFDSKIACLCQNNNKYVYRQSQVRMPNGSVVRWAECLLIIGTGCRVQVFSLILDSSVSLSAGIQSAGDWVSETLWVRILLSAEEDNLSPFDSKIACLCQSIEINNNKYVCMYVCICDMRKAPCFIPAFIPTSGYLTYQIATALYHYVIKHKINMYYCWKRMTSCIR